MTKEKVQPLRVVFFWQGMSGYMAACWRELSVLSDIKIRVYIAPSSGQYNFDETIMENIDWYQLSDREYSDSKKLKALINDFIPDIIVISGWGNRAYRRLTKLDWSSAPRFVMTMDTPWRGDTRQFLAPLLLFFYLRRIDLVFTPSRRASRYALWLGFTKDQIVQKALAYNDVGLEEAYLRRKRSWPRSFLFIGRYVKIKGIDILIDAYRQYREKSVNPWELVCCGQGDMKDMLASCIGVIDKGFIQPHQLADILAEAGCFVLPSTYEPWGVVLAEACGSGLPIIASKAVVSSDDLVVDGENGFLIESGNAEQLANLMLKIECLYDNLPSMGAISLEISKPYKAREWARNFESQLRHLNLTNNNDHNCS